MMTTVDIVYQHFQKMPESLVKEVLNFTEYLAEKYSQTDNFQATNEALFKLTGIAQGSGESVGRNHDNYLYSK